MEGAAEEAAEIETEERDMEGSRRRRRGEASEAGLAGRRRRRRRVRITMDTTDLGGVVALVLFAELTSPPLCCLVAHFEPLCLCSRRYALERLALSLRPCLCVYLLLGYYFSVLPLLCRRSCVASC